MPNKLTLGEMLIEKGLVSQESVNEALRIQSGGSRRLGHILVKMGLISDEDLFEALWDQNQIPVVNISEQITPRAQKLIPGYLCRRCGAIPIKVKSNNVLVLAMVNPLDSVVIDEIDNYTGMIVKPVLANQKEIYDAIEQYIPSSIRDFFYRFFHNPVFMGLLVVSLILSVWVGILLYRDINVKKYGIASESGGIKVFSNHELLIGVEGGKSISLIGHGPYAKGFYSVVFHDIKSLKEFVELKKDHFTSTQYQWIYWVLDKKITQLN